MSARRGWRKTVDESTVIRCAAGFGSMREEIWEDANGKVVRYNLAFIHHALMERDNGRVLGYDNAHGKHHRHSRGKVEDITFPGYEAIFRRFCLEVEVLRKETR